MRAYGPEEEAMQRHSKQRRFRGRKAGTLFGEPIKDPLGHLSARYPFPARLNDRYVAKLKASKVGISFSKGRFCSRRAMKPTGVYVVLEGRAKLSVNSAQGKTLVLGFFGPGTILGLAAAILGRTHATTAEIMKPTKVLFVSRKELAREMQGHVTAARQAAELVSEACYFILGKMSESTCPSPPGKSLHAASSDCSLTIRAPAMKHLPRLDLSQETIAQMVGLSRETVTRLLARFRRG